MAPHRQSWLERGAGAQFGDARVGAPEHSSAGFRRTEDSDTDSPIHRTLCSHAQRDDLSRLDWDPADKSKSGMSRCDLHLHSKFSARSEDWLFRRFDFPDSCTEPAELYAELRKRGMDFVTITDHDCIDGCVAIADKPHVFISEQVTVYFPQDPCKVHLLVWGINQAQHQDISVFRSDIFELQKYLAENGIAHAVAHPLYSINGKLNASHLERLILLFKHFEGINGLRDALLSELAQDLFNSLTPEKIDEFSKRHGLAPTHPEPWKKILVGGSDDHGSKFIASAYTETPAASSAARFLDHIRSGNCKPCGEGG